MEYDNSGYGSGYGTDPYGASDSDWYDAKAQSPPHAHSAHADAKQSVPNGTADGRGARDDAAEAKGPKMRAADKREAEREEQEAERAAENAMKAEEEILKRKRNELKDELDRKLLEEKEAQQHVDRLQTELAALNTKLQALEQELKEKTALQSELETDRIAIAKAVAELERDITALQSEIAAAERELTSLQTELNALAAEVDACAKEIERLAGSLKALAASKAVSEKTLRARENELKAAEQVLHDAEEDLKDSEADLKETISALRAAEDQLRASQEALSAARAALRAAESDSDVSKMEKANADALLTEAKGAEAAAAAAVVRLQKALDDIKPVTEQRLTGYKRKWLFWKEAVYEEFTNNRDEEKRVAREALERAKQHHSATKKELTDATRGAQNAATALLRATHKLTAARDVHSVAEKRVTDCTEIVRVKRDKTAAASAARDKARVARREAKRDVRAARGRVAEAQADAEAVGKALADEQKAASDAKALWTAKTQERESVKTKHTELSARKTQLTAEHDRKQSEQKENASNLARVALQLEALRGEVAINRSAAEGCKRRLTDAEATLTDKKNALEAAQKRAIDLAAQEAEAVSRHNVLKRELNTRRRVVIAR